MQTDDIRSALVALLSQPMAVASVVFLAGCNAAIWLLVFERVGLPPALGLLLLVPPLTLLVPLYVVFARWPGERVVRIPKRYRRSRRRVGQRVVRRRLGFGAFHPRLPLRLDEDGLPRVRIPLEPLVPPKDWPAYREAATRYPHL
jgi:hypothetical protein